MLQVMSALTPRAGRILALILATGAIVGATAATLLVRKESRPRQVRFEVREQQAKVQLDPAEKDHPEFDVVGTQPGKDGSTTLRGLNGEARADLADQLLQGLAQSKVAPEEDDSPGDRKALQAIARAWVDAKMIDKPFAVEDYTHFYKPLSEIELFGRKVLAIEYEYLEEWIGCCVNNGFSVLLSNTAGDDVSLHRFARENNCKIDVGKDVCCTPMEWAAQEKAGRFIRLSCRESSSYTYEAGDD
ncbi:hypothetical protein D7W79_18595 [Corallococcus exercitus]|uniref:hypothetical protein n=1 Tax=Corallococcus exercitus TaxID=2316736 RepID=UPI000EA04B55|nr:hypothetical protein [Corallococcus exercitus]RKG76123.1 hypothetical protein D7W79_18595 [Corallococcus exercitus]